MHLKKIAVLCIAVSLISISAFSYNYLDNVAPSQNPPQSLTPAQVPQFVVIGFDDNKYQDGVEWAGSLMRNRVNPKGTGNPGTFDSMPARASFYLMSWPASSNFYLKRALLDLYLDGNEIGNHTENHKNGADESFSILNWKDEINPCQSFLIDTLKIPASEIWGFRSPFLGYNNSGFSAIKELGFVYDCSIEEGEDTLLSPSNYFWPYTLNNGSPGAKFSTSTESHKPVDSSHKGLWEIPAYIITIPPDSACATYALQPGLRHRMFENAKIIAQDSSFDTVSGKMTGLDYNIWFDFNVTKEEFVGILKYNLDQHLKGNHAPFIFGAHSDFYSLQYISEPKGCKTTFETRRAAIAEFLDYALSKPEVRVIPPKELIRWMRNPVALGQSFNAACTLSVATVDSGTVTTAPQKTSFTKDELVTLTAAPSAGWVFNRWAGDIVGTSPSLGLRMYKSLAVKAIFVKQELLFDTMNVSANLVAKASWSADADPDSKVLESNRVADTATVAFWQAPLTGTTSPWVTYTATFSTALTTVKGIEVEYQCDKPVVIQFEQPDFTDAGDNSWAFYQYIAPTSLSTWTKIRIGVKQFYQPEYKVRDSVPLKLNTVRSLVFFPAIAESGDSARLRIRGLKFFYATAGIAYRPIPLTGSSQTIGSLRPGELVLTVPANDKYSITIYSLKGSKIFYSKELLLTKGNNRIELKGRVYAAGMYVLTVKSRSCSSVPQRVLVR